MTVYVVQTQERRGSDWFIESIYETQSAAERALQDVFKARKVFDGYIEVHAVKS